MSPTVLRIRPDRSGETRSHAEDVSLLDLLRALRLPALRIVLLDALPTAMVHFLVWNPCGKGLLRALLLRALVGDVVAGPVALLSVFVTIAVCFDRAVSVERICMHGN